MERSDFRVLLFRYRPYVTARGENSVKQEIFCAKKLSLYPPLGLAQLAGVLKHCGYEQTHIVDAWAEGLSESEFLERVKKTNPHLVGCTLWTTNLHEELSILQKVKQMLPDVLTAVGGPHLDIYPRECLQFADYVDFGVVGEAEESFVELLDAIRGGMDLCGIKGLVHRNGGVAFNGWRPPVKELDSLPYPDFSDLPIDRYYSELEKSAPFIYIFSTRGCQYRCRYCFNSRGRSFRKHSVAYAIDYIKFLKDSCGIKEVGFWDETFTFDKQRTLEFCSRYIQEEIALPYTIRTRVNHVDEEIIRALKKSGCRRIHYGIESGDQEVLDRMNRKMTIEQARLAVSLTKKEKIPVATNFMIGYLGESRQTFERTIKFIKELYPDHVNIFITTILPGTDLYFEALKKGVLERDVWQEYAMGELPEIDVSGLRLPGEDYSVDDLEKMLAEAYRRVYFRPRFVLKKLRAMRSPQRFRRHITQGMAMLLTHLPRSIRQSVRSTFF